MATSCIIVFFFKIIVCIRFINRDRFYFSIKYFRSKKIMILFYFNCFVIFLVLLHTFYLYKNNTNLKTLTITLVLKVKTNMFWTRVFVVVITIRINQFGKSNILKKFNVLSSDTLKLVIIKSTKTLCIHM